jgi:bidirectional [NiFe] hydrogenase diaphorase subunit
MAAPIDLREVAARELEEQSRTRWRAKACAGTACLAAGAGTAIRAMDDEVSRSHLGHEVRVTRTGCMGLCSKGPLLRMLRRGGAATGYHSVSPESAVEIIHRHVDGTRPAAGAVLDDGIPFFARQRRIVLENGGVVDPDRIESYVAHGGYAALEKALTTMTPSRVVEEIRASGLRGRGGAGYPTAGKWEVLAAAQGGTKFVVANGDDGDPGASVGRAVMEDDPHRLLEGIAIAAYATGSSRAYIYIRAGYLRTVERLDRAIREARRRRLLGRQILDTDFSFDVEVRSGAGAFVCGEETALLASVEGQRGTPRLRPPYPTERGLWGFPTVVNNVETLANIAPIVTRGAAWFRSIGIPSSPGTKVLALAGDIDNRGIVEVPMGTSLREVVQDIGGGVPEGFLKAVQTGGPSGGCIPARFLDTPVDFDSLREVGSTMGSGSLIVMNDSVSMPAVAEFFIRFSMEESCGKCVPCRAGTAQMHRLLQKIRAGRGTRQDITVLEQLCRVVRETSLCGLGQSAPIPVLATLQHFGSEYDELVNREEVSLG